MAEKLTWLFSESQNKHRIFCQNMDCKDTTNTDVLQKIVRYMLLQCLADGEILYAGFPFFLPHTKPVSGSL